MATYSLIVKGTPDEAQRRFDLEFQGRGEDVFRGEAIAINRSDARPWTEAKLLCDDMGAGGEVVEPILNAWFAKDLGLTAPYPVGSLLLWSKVERYVTATEVLNGTLEVVA